MLTDIKARLALLKEKVKDFFHSFGSLVVLVLLFSIIMLPFFFLARWSWKRSDALYEKVMSIETYHNDNSILVPPNAEIYVFQPQGEQDVVIVGNPESIKVKPKNKK